jgi:hypothetical protein
VHLWPAGRPADWPPEDVPPLSGDEIVMRGEGSFGGSKIPSAIALPGGGSAVIWNLWDHADKAAGAQTGQAFTAASAGPVLPLLALLALMGIASSSARPPKGRGR